MLFHQKLSIMKTQNLNSKKSVFVDPKFLALALNKKQSESIKGGIKRALANRRSNID